MNQPVAARGRLELIDLARGIALLAMAIYHFNWDLEFFGYVMPGTAASGGWKLFARCIASSFLFLVGVSLVLAHARGIRWRPFLKRVGMVAAAAAAISLVTYIAVPSGFIFFGILHQIALASVLGLGFIRLPAIATIIVAILVILAPNYLRSSFFDHPALWWIGLSETRPRSNDFVPLFPWFGPVLLGIAGARIAERFGLFERLRHWHLPPSTRVLQKAGQHSLAFYLIHQPVLIALIWTIAQIAPPAQIARDVEFSGACTAQCANTHDADFCSIYCNCVLAKLEAENRFDEVFEGRPSAETSRRLQQMVEACTFEADVTLPAEQVE